MVMVFILIFYWIHHFKRKSLNKPEGHLPDPRFMGSTAFLVGECGVYSGAVIPIPLEGVTIGNNENEANIIIDDQGIASRHVFVSFPVGEYDSVVIEDFGGEGGTFYNLSSEQGNWEPIQGTKRFSIESPGRIRVGNKQIFTITFRL
jgi:hypothetical protein